MNVKPYFIEDESVWDHAVEQSMNGCFLHTRRFLNYHGDRFEDHSLMIEGKKSTALLPAARDLHHPSTVISHPGSSFGGMIHTGELVGEKMLDALSLCLTHYREQGFSQFIYKHTPSIYQRMPCEDDLSALFRLGAQQTACELNCVIDLTQPSRLSNAEQGRLRQRCNKAQRCGLILSQDLCHLHDFWALLCDVLKTQHDAQPVHHIKDIESLFTCLGEGCQLVTAHHQGQLLAGTLLFIHQHVVHTQYLALSKEGREYYALDYTLNSVIEWARKERKKYFSFGISTENEGHVLNKGLFASKAKHGGMGLAHAVYTLKLE